MRIWIHTLKNAKTNLIYRSVCLLVHAKGPHNLISVTVAGTGPVGAIVMALGTPGYGKPSLLSFK